MQLKKNPSQKRGVSTCTNVPGRMERSINRVILGGKISMSNDMLRRSIVSRLTLRKPYFFDKFIALKKYLAKNLVTLSNISAEKK